MFASDRTMAAVASASAAARSFSVEMVSEVWSSRKAVSSPSVSQFCSLIRFVKLTLVIRMLLRNAIASLSPPSGGLLLFQFREDAGESRAHPFQVLANDDLEVLFGTRQLLEVGAEPRWRWSPSCPCRSCGPPLRRPVDRNADATCRCANECAPASTRRSYRE